MMALKHSRILRTITALMAACAVALPVQADDTGTGGSKPTTQSSRYVFLSDQSKLVQTSGIAGLHRTYAIEGHFLLTVDPHAGAASFRQVDANAVDDSPFKHSLDPNEVFNLTGLDGAILDDGSIRFEGKANDQSSIVIRLTFQDSRVTLNGQTIPPPGSADFFVFTLDAVAQRKYSGGSGTAQVPYQIATAADLIALGETPDDYGKHFLLTADIDLDPNLPGRKLFDKAVIAPNLGTPFTGVFDGNGHTISHLRITGVGYLGMFGQLGSGAQVKNLGVADVNIVGSGNYVGGLAGYNGYDSTVIQCYTTGAVSGNTDVGGLAGFNWGAMIQSYSTGAVTGDQHVGGLVGPNLGTVTQCYSTGLVSGSGEGVGGMVGRDWANAGGYARGRVHGTATACFWDTETSGQATSFGGEGKTTAEMQDPNTFMAAGWDFVGEADGPHDIWAEPPGGGYPILWWQQSPLPKLPFSGGTGEPDDPYHISTPNELNSIGYNPRLMRAHFELVNDIDLSAINFYIIGSDELYPFTGSFNGNGHTVSHLTIAGRDYVGLFSRLEGEVKNLGVVDVNITSSGGFVGGLAGWNGGSVTQCYSAGVVSGGPGQWRVGGLVGLNAGSVTNCYSTGTVNGGGAVGGLVGENDWGSSVSDCYSVSAVSGGTSIGGLVGENWYGTVTQCHSMGMVTGGLLVGGLVGQNFGTVTRCYCTGAVSGTMWDVGGLVGSNRAAVTQCYSTGAVRGDHSVGGLVGENYLGTVTHCYSTGMVSGTRSRVGGLVGYNWNTPVTACFWDIQTSGQATSDGGTRKATAEMQKAQTFLDAGWDFMGETVNGTEDLWWILEGKDYPRLGWERSEIRNSNIETRNKSE